MTNLERFDSIVDLACVINLPKRIDRWEAFQQRIAEYLPVERILRVDAIDGQSVQCPANWSDSAGHYGCLLSFMKVFDIAIERKSRNVLVFEDDVCLRPTWLRYLQFGFKELPTNWVVLNLGPRYKPGIQPHRYHSQHLVRCFKAFANHAVMFNGVYLERLKSVIQQRVELTGKNMDAHLRYLQRRDSSMQYFALRPNQAGQVAGVGDTSGYAILQDTFWDDGKGTQIKVTN